MSVSQAHLSRYSRCPSRIFVFTLAWIMTRSETRSHLRQWHSVVVLGLGQAFVMQGGGSPQMEDRNSSWDAETGLRQGVELTHIYFCCFLHWGEQYDWSLEDLKRFQEQYFQIAEKNALPPSVLLYHLYSHVHVLANLVVSFVIWMDKISPIHIPLLDVPSFSAVKWRSLS